MFIPRLPFQLQDIDDCVLFEPTSTKNGYGIVACWNNVLTSSNTATAAGGVVSP